MMMRYKAGDTVMLGRKARIDIRDSVLAALCQRMKDERRAGTVMETDSMGEWIVYRIEFGINDDDLREVWWYEQELEQA